jgi:pyrroloquinoline quinone (PQQ) biosynthesis protein C
MHYKLFGKALQSLGLSKAEINAGPRFTHTSELVSGMQHLYQNSDIRRGMGAQYALERQAFPMIDNLHKGFGHYTDLTDADFEYFKLHLVEEPEHLKSMQESVARYVSSPEDVSVIKAGATECLDLIASFWQRLFIEVMALERG